MFDEQRFKIEIRCLTQKRMLFFFFLYIVQEKKACRVDTFTEDKDQHLEQTTIIFETQHEIATSNKENKIKYTE